METYRFINPKWGESWGERKEEGVMQVDFQQQKLFMKVTNLISSLHFFKLIVHMGTRQLKPPL